MDGWMETEGCNIFWGWVLLRWYLSREADFGRDFGKVGIVGLGWAGLSYAGLLLI